ncbi:alpha-L-rhamnosidase-related protein [Wenyingzhuangia sp. IMCC45574]
MKKSFLSLLIVCFSINFNCSYAQTTTRENSYKIERNYITPKRIVWQSGIIKNANQLLKEGRHQATTINKNVVHFKNDGGTSAILLDFGKELHGGLEIITGMFKGHSPINVRIRFGESVSEAMSNLGEDGATNDHSVRDMKLQVPWCGKIEVGNTGFRFVRIDVLDKERVLLLKEVSAISVMRDIPYLGSFKSNDERLNKIWEIGAYTVHLNMQEYLWDGIKRDRLVWVGDMHPEVMTILAAFGKNEVVTKSLDLMEDITPLPGWMNGKFSSYSMWWLLIQHQWYMNTGDINYLQKHKGYIYGLLALLEENIDANGKENFKGECFLDWPTRSNQTEVRKGMQALLAMSFDAGQDIAKAFDDKDKAKHYKMVSKKLKSYKHEFPTRKSPGALLSMAGILNPKKVNKQLLVKNGAKDISTFYGYYVLNAMALGGNHQEAIDLIREYWGAMIDLGATSFWEDFDIDWIKNAGRIDEIVPDGKIDVHRTYGKYCYVGLRHSFCHGWASGPTAWLSQYVLGVQIMAPGCKIIKIEPHLGDLTYVEGTYPTPYGIVSIKHTKDANGKITSEIKAPKEIEIIKVN